VASNRDPPETDLSKLIKLSFGAVSLQLLGHMTASTVQVGALRA